MTSHRGPAPRRAAARAAAACAFLVAAAASAQYAPALPPVPPEATPSPPVPSSGQPSPPGPAAPEAGAIEAAALAPLAWLGGCWQGTVNQREFREQWLPLRGGTLVGAAQQVARGRMQDYEFLRIESRADGIFFSQFSGDRRETSFRLAGTATDEKDTIFTFANTAAAFPARLIYRRGADGWLYETIEGSVNGSDKRVIYPMRRIDCESGELIEK